jgi:hypothetical protein
MSTARFSRRSFLESAGFLLGLPAFESLLKGTARAASQGVGLASDGSPLRLAFIYAPNGAIMDRWTPKGQGRDFQLNDTMQPLAEFRADMQVVSGLEHQHGWAGPDGGGDHARAMATILTGARPKKKGPIGLRVSTPE